MHSFGRAFKDILIAQRGPQAASLPLFCGLEPSWAYARRTSTGTHHGHDGPVMARHRPYMATFYHMNGLSPSSWPLMVRFLAALTEELPEGPTLATQ